MIPISLEVKPIHELLMHDSIKCLLPQKKLKQGLQDALNLQGGQNLINDIPEYETFVQLHQYLKGKDDKFKNLEVPTIHEYFRNIISFNTSANRMKNTDIIKEKLQTEELFTQGALDEKKIDTLLNKALQKAEVKAEPSQIPTASIVSTINSNMTHGKPSSAKPINANLNINNVKTPQSSYLSQLGSVAAVAGVGALAYYSLYGNTNSNSMKDIEIPKHLESYLYNACRSIANFINNQIKSSNTVIIPEEITKQAVRNSGASSALFNEIFEILPRVCEVLFEKANEGKNLRFGRFDRAIEY